MDIRFIARCRVVIPLIVAIVSVSPICADDVAGADGQSSQGRLPELAIELKQRVEEDQQAREEWVSFYQRHQLPFGTIELDKLDPGVAAEFRVVVEKLEAEDARNLAWLKATIGRHGWPGRTLVGSEGAHNAWLLVQHADADREFQRDCLEKIEALPKGEVAPIDIAYLTDRILVGSGQKQKFGTQADFVEGKAVPKPIEDEARVDRRRHEIGLGPLAEYLSEMEKFYGAAKESNADSDDAPK